ncbi:MAG: adenylyltransferase/cytidyltransferase family protein, partial [Bacteroidales bacterium]|nr:adenylyltransferase/cytidyltransferase family protein [Bacteroidales bacterium]
MNEQPITRSAPSCPPPSRGELEGGSIALFPGSFDPFTIGHADIVRRGLQLFDRIVIAVGYNAQKTSGTPIADRVAAIEHWAASLSESAPSCCASQPESAPSCCAVNNAAIESPRVKVVAYSDLTVDLAQREGARFLLRGVRSVKDFEYERDLAAINSDR